LSVVYSANGITKRFGPVQALSGVDFDIEQGKVNGLIGANGAGKSTLLKIIAGAVRPDTGELRLDGELLSLASTADAAKAGIAIVSQELNLFPALCVEENLLLAPAGGAWSSRQLFRRRAEEVLAKLGVDIALHTSLWRLSLAERQLIEIARALLQDPRVLILDEPTSSLHAAEVDRLHEVVRGLRDSGIGMIYVSHFLEELLDISDNLVVLRNGQRVPVQFAPSRDRLKDVVAAMLDEPLKEITARSQNAPNDNEVDISISPIEVGSLRIVGLRGPGGLVVDELEVHPGEVVGIAGLAGAGVEELFSVLFGLTKPTAGTVTLPTGAPLPLKAANTVKAGVAYVPGDRKSHGVMLRQSIAENVMSVRALTLGRDGFVLKSKRLADSAAERCRRLGVVAGSVQQPVGTLSGGNQQKVVFAKWIEAAPSLLVLDDPTKGIDVGAKREMHRIMRQLARSGRVVLFSSSDPGETAAIADRVFVFSDGMLTHELRGDGLTEHELITAMNTSAEPLLSPAA
jgi:ABC-type sugar transport system ATPase subunit